MPTSTLMAWPEIHEPWSLQRKSAMFGISSPPLGRREMRPTVAAHASLSRGMSSRL